MMSAWIDSEPVRVVADFGTFVAAADLWRQQ